MLRVILTSLQGGASLVPLARANEVSERAMRIYQSVRPLSLQGRASLVPLVQANEFSCLVGAGDIVTRELVGVAVDGCVIRVLVWEARGGDYHFPWLS